MTSIATDTANDVGGEVALLGTVVLAVTNLPTVLASLVLIVTKGTVESGEFSQLVALELILAFGDGRSLLLLVFVLEYWNGKDLQFQ